MPTVADVLRKMERIKKDLEYVRSFQEKWREQKDRFPKIYEGIVEQEKFFLRKIEDLKLLRVDTAESMAAEPTEPIPTPAPQPAIIPGTAEPAGAAAPADGGDDKRAAAADAIGEKLRKRVKPPSGEKASDAAIRAPDAIAIDAGK